MPSAFPIKAPKKLIEVALPLDAINTAAAREKSIRHGHPSTLHLWWARRPLAAARAVIFSQLVNDPSWKWEMEHPGEIPPGHLKASWAASRKRLFKIIEDLVLWENTTNEAVLERAREEIRKSWRETCELNKDHPQAAELFDPKKLPALHDPFAGGGAIPLEAQRLGLEAWASDLNPVAVLINKAMIEIPPKFAGRPPVSLGARASRPHKGWNSRGYLPHFDQPGLVQSITFRLHDSVPAKQIEKWREELGWHGGMSGTDPAAVELRERLERFSDAGHGECWLKDDRIAKIVEDALLYFDNQRYRVVAWCVMPNHVHVIIETIEGHLLSDIVHSWKSFTAKEANRLLERSGAFWMEDYYDRFIRDAKHFRSAKEYVEQNPVAAGLVKQAEDWRWSSARRFVADDAGGTPALPGELPLDREWKGATGLAEDVRYYGQWMRDEAQKRIGHLYPKVKVVREKDGTYRHATEEEIASHEDTKARSNERNFQSSLLRGFVPSCETKVEELTVIAWIWARTVKSPNPAFSHVDVPLASTFILSSKAGKEAYVQPVIEGDSYRFDVKVGKPPEGAKEGTKLARGANFKCLLSNIAIEGDYIKSEGRSGRLNAKMMAVVAEGSRGRVYLAPTDEMETVAASAVPSWRPELQLPGDMRAFWTPPYGVTHYHHLFTPRQLVALTTFSDLVGEARERCYRDALDSGNFSHEGTKTRSMGKMDGDRLSETPPVHPSATPCENASSSLRAFVPSCEPPSEPGLESGGSGAKAYAEAVAVYLGLGVSRVSDSGSSLTTWASARDSLRTTFGRQALPMVWDYAEANPIESSAGSFYGALEWVSKAILSLPGEEGSFSGLANQSDAQTQTFSRDKVISTDPPYYDNIGYADLSDFFYVWLRKSLKDSLPSLFTTIAVPKAEELVATPYRHGNKLKAEAFFLDGMTSAMQRLADLAHPSAPITIYYAFKQSETSDDAGTLSPGWVTFLGAVHQAGMQLCGTWPMRTEREGRSIGVGTNALASSIILVCRKRPADAPTISRREFQRELNRILPEALDEMTKGSGEDRSPVAPVDLSQAIIGPGMAVFSKYSAVLEADGTPMSVRTALQLINRFLAEDDFDADTQFCLHWFDQYDWQVGPFGEADTLARAKGTSVDGVKQAGVIESGGGKVRLLKWAEYVSHEGTKTRSGEWKVEESAVQLRDFVASCENIWGALHSLILSLRTGGETQTGQLLSQVAGKAESIRQLAYRLYTLCERKNWAEDARAYNELITSWTAVEAAASASKSAQGELFL